jgi:hypothetical protein
VPFERYIARLSIPERTSFLRTSRRVGLRELRVQSASVCRSEAAPSLYEEAYEEECYRLEEVVVCKVGQLDSDEVGIGCEVTWFAGIPSRRWATGRDRPRVCKGVRERVRVGRRVGVWVPCLVRGQVLCCTLCITSVTIRSLCAISDFQVDEKLRREMSGGQKDKSRSVPLIA